MATGGPYAAVHARPDGESTVARMATTAAEYGFAGVVVRNHGDAPASYDPATIGETYGVDVVTGVEVRADDRSTASGYLGTHRPDHEIVAVHGGTETMNRFAVEQPPVDVLAHPTNRLINEREPFDLDLDAVVAAAADAGVAIEINAQPERLDLDWAAVKEYRHEVEYVVSTDAHTAGELDFLHLGVAQARRGWCEPGDVLNTLPLDELRSFFDS